MCRGSVIIELISRMNTYCCVFGVLLYHSCVRRGSVIIGLISRMNSQRGCWVCEKSKKTYVLRSTRYFLGGGLMRNIYTRYHICLMRVKSRRVSLERRFDVKYSSCRYHRYCCLLHITCILVKVQNITTLLLSLIHI